VREVRGKKTDIHYTTSTRITRNTDQREKERGEREIEVFTTLEKSANDIHTKEPCIIASHALLLCNVLMKWLRFGSVASAEPAVLIAGE